MRKWIIIVMIMVMGMSNAEAVRLSNSALNTTGIDMYIFGNLSFNNVSMFSGTIYIDTFLDFHIFNRSGKDFAYQSREADVNLTFSESNVYHLYDAVNLSEGDATGILDTRGNLIDADLNLTVDSDNLTKWFTSAIRSDINISASLTVDSCNNVHNPRYNSTNNEFNEIITSYECANNFLFLNISHIEDESSNNILAIDSQNPNMTLNLPADNATDDSVVDFQYIVDDANIGNCTLFSKYGSGFEKFINTAITANATVTESAANLTEDTHTWNVDCVDDLNNNVSTTTRTLTISAGGGGGGGGAGGGGGGGGGVEALKGVGIACSEDNQCASSLCDLTESQLSKKKSNNYGTCQITLCGNGIVNPGETFTNCKEDAGFFQQAQSDTVGFVIKGAVPIILISAIFLQTTTSQNPTIRKIKAKLSSLISRNNNRRRTKK